MRELKINHCVLRIPKNFSVCLAFALLLWELKNRGLTIFVFQSHELPICQIWKSIKIIKLKCMFVVFHVLHFNFARFWINCSYFFSIHQIQHFFFHIWKNQNLFDFSILFILNAFLISWYFWQSQECQFYENLVCRHSSIHFLVRLQIPDLNFDMIEKLRNSK